MAKVRISELPQTTSLTNNDEFPVNQSGITKRITLSQVVSAVNISNVSNSTGGGPGTLVVSVSGFDPNTAECDVTLIWDCNLKKFVATKQPKFDAPPAASSIKKIGLSVGGYQAVVAITNSNRIVYWGFDNNVIGGRGKNVTPNNYVTLKLINTNGTTPTHEDYLSINPTINVVDVQYGKYGIMALLSDNTVWLNGSGPEIKGSLEISSTHNLVTGYTKGYLLKVKAPSSEKFTKISYGSDNDTVSFNCMLLTENKDVYVFGSNHSGMCGAGVAANTNVEITNSNSNISQVQGKAIDIHSGSSQNGCSLILTDDGELWGAGYNYYGQLGQDDDDNKLTFVKISSNVRYMAKGLYMTQRNIFFIKNDGTIWGCGRNYNNQLRSENTTDSDVPVQITQTSTGNFVKIDVAGGSSDAITCIAMTDNGRVYTWGYNAHGACGNGTTTVVKTPTLVNNPKDGNPLLAKDIYASHNYSTGNCLYIVGQNDMLYAAGYRAWTNNKQNPADTTNSYFYPFSVNLKTDKILNFNLLDYDYHYGMFLTTTDGHLLYKGKTDYNQASNITDDITEFSYVM
jgi:alpha-tubulin suppressor-like RCC1 family protein